VLRVVGAGVHLRLPAAGGAVESRRIMATTSELPWQEVHENLRAFIGRRVRNPADADDLVQRVLLQIVKGLGSLRDSERLHAWVYRTARNVIADYYRSPAARREVAGGDAEDLDAGRPGTQMDGAPEDDSALRELASCLAPMLEQLPDAYREAITLTEIEGLNQAEAARQSGVSVSGMKSRVQRGRRRLRAVLEECCRIDLDRRGGVMGYQPRSRSGCGSGGCP
jgi:RNA polymerase sigma-70 factor (ECF subfamily)